MKTSLLSMPTVSVLLLLLVLSGQVDAQSEIYACVDKNGRTEYKNTGDLKGCKRLDLPSMSTIPVPKRPVQTASSRSSSSDFPKIDSAAQKARDTDRRQILVDEMKTEERKLAELQKEFNNGEPERRGDERNYAKYQERVASLKDSITRTEKNIEALRREISNLK